MIRWGVTAFLVLVGFSARAASPYKQTLDVKANAYLNDGVFIGGKAGGGTALLGVRRAYSAKAQMERIIVDLGDQNAKPSGQNPGYYQVSMDAANRRVELDLAQLRLSKISEAQIQNLFRQSPNVQTAELTLDPEDKAATMVLKLKHPMRMEVFQLTKPGKPGRVVIDLKPVANVATRKTISRASSLTSSRKSSRREAFE